MKQYYTIEPIKKNGALDAKRVGEAGGLDTIRIEYNKLWDKPFSALKCDSMSWDTMIEWYTKQGYRVREIRW